MVDSIVDILMVTYNHEKYISQAIESVLNQKADFPYRLIIGEDCSSDGTKKICLKYANTYPEKIWVMDYETNQGLLKNYMNVFNASKAKYIAILEGDDYWNDETKLQKQFDYLEEYPNVGLVHSNSDLVFESGKIQKGSHNRYRNFIKNGIVFEQLLVGNYIRTATVMMKKCLYDNYVSIENYINKGFKTFDYPAWLDIAQHTEFHYLDYSTATYRIHNNSISHSDDYNKNKEFLESMYAIKRYNIEKDKCNLQLVKLVNNHYLADSITLEMSVRNYQAVQNLREKLKIYSLKNLILKLITLNRYCVNVYYIINKKRQEIIRNGFKLKCFR